MDIGDKHENLWQIRNTEFEDVIVQEFNTSESSWTQVLGMLLITQT